MANKKSFLKERNWFVAAGLTFFIYLILVGFYFYFNIHGHVFFKVLHALPIIAVLMVFLGFHEKRRWEDEDADRKRKRYEMRKRIIEQSKK